MEVWIASLIVAGAFTIFGITGFGSAVIAVPLLSLIYPLEVAVSTMLLLEFIASLLMSIQNKFVYDKFALLRIFPSTLVGMVFAIWILTLFNNSNFILVLALLVLWNGLVIIFNIKIKLIHSRRSIRKNILGLCAGIFGVLFTTGGVFVASYLVDVIDDPKMLRKTMGLTILVITGSILGLMFLYGVQIRKQAISLTMALIIPMMFGASLGLYFFKGISLETMKRIYGSLLICAGLLLFAKEAIRQF